TALFRSRPRGPGRLRLLRRLGLLGLLGLLRLRGRDRDRVVAVAGRITVDEDRRWERLDRSALVPGVHRRLEGARRVGAAVELRQVALELLVALAADVHHRGGQLRGVADEPRRGDLALGVGRRAGLAGGRPAARELGVAARARPDDLLEGVGGVGGDVGVEQSLVALGRAVLDVAATVLDLGDHVPAV